MIDAFGTALQSPLSPDGWLAARQAEDRSKGQCADCHGKWIRSSMPVLLTVKIGDTVSRVVVQGTREAHRVLAAWATVRYAHRHPVGSTGYVRIPL